MIMMPLCVQTVKGMVIDMNNLQKLGYEICGISKTTVEFIKVVDKGYEEHYIKIDFENKTIQFSARYNNSTFTYVDGGVSLEVLEASIDVLNDRKVVIDYALQDNR